VSLGGDIATAGPVPEGGWRVLVRDQPGDPQCTIALPNGGGLATSSTVSRQWRQGGRTLHHILDPRTSQPVAPVWRTASIVANTCVDANTFSTAALIRGYDAPIWLHQLGLPARLVSRDGNVVTLNGWPDEDGMR
jgi:thiamine biosynthesis lipoprotein